MRFILLRFILLIALASGINALHGSSVFAGGGSFDDMDEHDDESGPPFIGDVKDKNGTPIADSKVSVTVAAYNSTVFIRTDDQGHFNVKGFDKEIKPDQIEISCSMEGYKPYAISRQVTGPDPRSPIEVICLLEKGP
jgi:hypothetical protein